MDRNRQVDGGAHAGEVPPGEAQLAMHESQPLSVIIRTSSSMSTCPLTPAFAVVRLARFDEGTGRAALHDLGVVVEDDAAALLVGVVAADALVAQ